MAHIDITDTGLTVTVTGYRRALGRWRPLPVAWHHVVSARPAGKAARGLPGARWGWATTIPGVIHVGSFRHVGSRDSWDVARPASAIVIELTGHKYDRLIVEVDDPAAVLAAIGEHLPTGTR